jgi:hypothetical protein
MHALQPPSQAQAQAQATHAAPAPPVASIGAPGAANPLPAAPSLFKYAVLAVTPWLWMCVQSDSY